MPLAAAAAQHLPLHPVAGTPGGPTVVQGRGRRAAQVADLHLSQRGRLGGRHSAAHHSCAAAAQLEERGVPPAGDRCAGWEERHSCQAGTRASQRWLRSATMQLTCLGLRLGPQRRRQRVHQTKAQQIRVALTLGAWIRCGSWSWCRWMVRAGAQACTCQERQRRQ